MCVEGGRNPKPRISCVPGDGLAVSWGDAEGGGDSVAVQDRLKNVQQIQASSTAFATRFLTLNPETLNPETLNLQTLNPKVWVPFLQDPALRSQNSQGFRVLRV